MGLNLSCLGAGGKPGDGIPPEDVHKGLHEELLDPCHEGTEPGAENTAADGLTPAPSVVIAWVLRDVADWPAMLQSNDEKLKRELESAVHAARLHQCWKTNRGEFPKAFAAELSAVLGSIGDTCYNHKVWQLTSFLWRVFGTYRSNGGEDLYRHIVIDSGELLPPTLDEFRRKHEQVVQGAEWAEPAGHNWRGRTLALLQGLDDCLSWNGNTKTLKKEVRKLKAELFGVHQKAFKIQEEAARLKSEAETAAKIARLRDSLKRAPWEEELA